MKGGIPLLASLVVVLAVGTVSLDSYRTMAVPVRFQEASTQDIEQALVRLNAPQGKLQELSTAVYRAHQATGISKLLLVALMKTESNFNYKAVSPKNYKGLMQTPSATFQFADVDVLHGACILKEKLLYTNGNLPMALALYKGGDNKQAHQQAGEVITLFRKLER